MGNSDPCRLNCPLQWEEKWLGLGPGELQGGCGWRYQKLRPLETESGPELDPWLLPLSVSVYLHPA